MTNASVGREQRYTRDHACPVCGGWDNQRRGRGERCWGYVLSDGSAAICTRRPSDRELEGGWLHRLVEPPRRQAEAEQVYDYRDAKGRLVHQTIRRFPKRFMQRRPAAADHGLSDWIWNLRGIDTVLYRLPELRAANAADWVFVGEGEKDADRLRALGLVATCNPMGAKKWKPSYSEALRDRNVVLLEDNDDAGRQHVELVRKALDGVARCVVTLGFRELKEGGDVSDWLDAGHTAADLLERVDRARDEVGTEVRNAVPRSNGSTGALELKRADEASPALAAIPNYPLEALPDALRELVDAGYQAGLPRTLVAGAALAALAAALGGQASLSAVPGWSERAVLWLALLAPRGAGKSPAQQFAFGPLRERDRAAWPGYRQQLDLFAAANQKGERPVDPTILFGDATIEALARRLSGTSSLPLVLDELSVLLRGLGEYKRGGGGDRGRFLELWTGDDWRFTRVGANAKATNSVDLLIVAPTLVIVGGLQPRLHTLLGGEEDGMRPRWLPHLAGMPTHASSGTGAIAPSWNALLDELVMLRDRPRHWQLGPTARARFFEWQRHWKLLAREADQNASTSAALVKADIHVLRVSLVLAEAMLPGSGGAIPTEIVDAAASIVNFTLDCWRALPEADGLALSRKDEVLDAAVARLVDWLEQHGGVANRRQLLLSNTAGVKTARDLDALLERYADTYPGTIIVGESTGGRPPVLVHAPTRREALVNSPALLGPKQSQERPHGHRNGHFENENGHLAVAKESVSDSNKVAVANKVDGAEAS